MRLCRIPRVMRDTVFINQLAATAIVGKDAWNRSTPQPLLISVAMATDFLRASDEDNLDHSLNYAVISRLIAEYVERKRKHNFQSLAGLTASVWNLVKTDYPHVGVTVDVMLAKLEIRALRLVWTKSEDIQEAKIAQLRLLTVIGVFTFERLQKQVVDLDIKLTATPQVLFREVIDSVVSYVENSNFKTVETLVSRVSQLILQNNEDTVKSVDVKVTKPNAINYTEGVGVSSKFNFGDFHNVPTLETENPNELLFNLPVKQKEIEDKEHTVYIAFGLNVGNQMAQIRHALDLLNQYKVKVLATSLMYLSKPMYFKDQPNFYNGVFKATTRQTPHQLLATLKKIEYEHIDRKKDFSNGPRLIDLDIILYDDVCVNTEDLVVPHKLMLERTFVMEPLCELIPPNFIHPVTLEPVHHHLHQLLKAESDGSIQELSHLEQLVPMPRLDGDVNPLKFDQLHNSRETLIMGILNTTPDSFSDGGANYGKDLAEVEANALALVEQGASIIDIGGVLTRPGSTEPLEEEEIKRVVPFVKMIRQSSHPKLQSVVISIDTYRAKVAAAALEAGADIINDVLMGLYEPEIFDVVAKYNCPYVMNHTRGTPASMSKLTDYCPNSDHDLEELFVDLLQGEVVPLSFDTNALITGVSRELGQQVAQAFQRGVRKWQIILDPGVGFAKNKEQNLAITRHARYFKRYAMSHADGRYLSFNGMALLVGTSRKKFLGAICSEPEATKRVIATTSTTVALIEQATDIIRVHDVAANKQAALVGDALYRHQL